MGIDNTPKNLEMIYNRFPSTPCFLRCHILNRKCGTSVQYMNASINCFKPETSWNATCCQKASHHIHNSVVLPLAYTIPLGCISCCKLSLDSMVLIKKLQIHVSYILHSNPCEELLLGCQLLSQQALYSF